MADTVMTTIVVPLNGAADEHLQEFDGGEGRLHENISGVNDFGQATSTHIFVTEDEGQREEVVTEIENALHKGAPPV